jgi:TonB family protein
MLRTSYAIIVGSSMFVSAGAQSASPQTASVSPLAVTIHQRLNPSCELVQPAVLRDNGKYASLAIPETAVEVYSPELAKDDFLAYSTEVPGKLVKLARKSGFRVKPSGSDAEGISPRVVDIDGSSHCPNLEEALQTAELKRINRRRQVQSKLYHPNFDNVTPPNAVSAPQPKSDQQTTGAATPGNASPIGAKAKVQGTDVLAAVVGSDGAVSQVKVVHSLTPELDRRAVEAVKTWKFQPARKDGLPVPVLINVEVNFHLY